MAVRADTVSLQPSRYSMATHYYQPDGGFIATSNEFPGLSAFGVSRSEALKELEVAIELAISQLQAEGLPVPQPLQAQPHKLPSGEFRLRLPRRLHAELALQAERDGVSQNTLVVAFVARGIEHLKAMQATKEMELV